MCFSFPYSDSAFKKELIGYLYTLIGGDLSQRQIFELQNMSCKYLKKYSINLLKIVCDLVLLASGIDSGGSGSLKKVLIFLWALVVHDCIFC